MSKAFALATGLTPDGVVCCTAPALSEEWFAARREGITATDVPKILGLSEYGNAVSVWMDKRGEWTDEAGEAAEWGHELEPVIAKVWCQRNNTRYIKPEMLARRGQEHLRASLDGIVSRCPLGLTDREYSCGLEVKTRSAWVAGQWRDDMPDDVLAQVGHQRIVTGLGHIHVACLIGGQRLVEYLYQRDDALEVFLLAEAERVWRHVLDGTQPLVDPNALLTRVLNVLYADRDGIAELDLDKTIDMLTRYDTERLTITAAKRRQEAAKAEMVLALTDKEAATVELTPGEPTIAYTYKPNVNGVRTLRITEPFKSKGPTE